MTKKIPLGIALAFVFIAIAATAAVTVMITTRAFNSVVSDLPEREQQFKSIAEIDELVRAEYDGDVNSAVLSSYMAQTYIDSLGDEYSRYMTSDEYAEYLASENGKTVGTGITGKLNIGLTAIEVTAVADGSPAAEAGVEVGDSITAVGGKEVDEKNSDGLIKSLSESGRGKLEIKYTRTDESGEQSENTVSLEREYTVSTVKYSTSGELGYITVASFNNSTAEQFSEVLAEMKNVEINKLILDLRGNSSGNIAAGAAVTDLMVPLATEGSMSVATVSRTNGETVEIFTADSAAFNCKAVVLVDSGTSGAAELLACDLRDYGFAVLMGEKTAGRGVMQKLFELDNGDAVLLTVGRITPYISESYDKTGLTPDIAVENDKAYDTAVSYLLG